MYICIHIYKDIHVYIYVSIHLSIYIWEPCLEVCPLGISRGGPICPELTTEINLPRVIQSQPSSRNGLRATSRNSRVSKRVSPQINLLENACVGVNVSHHLGEGGSALRFWADSFDVLDLGVRVYGDPGGGGAALCFSRGYVLLLHGLHGGAYHAVDYDPFIKSRLASRD